MKISNLKFQNFRSYGNNMQDISLNINIGELILLTGKNGGGKTSIQETIEYCLFGKVRGKKGKNVVLSTLPNRLNKKLYTELEFISSDNTTVKIIRTMNPNKVTLHENDVPYPKANSIQDRIEYHTNIDFETYKSFISMSINDFKDFMELSLEEKRKLMNKLFNLEITKTLSELIKNLRKTTITEISDNNIIINTIISNIESTKESITKLTEKKNQNLEQTIKGLKKQLLDNKVIVDKYQQNIVKLDNKIPELKEKCNAIKQKLVDCNIEIKECNNQLEVYAKGKCPTCNSDLTDNLHSTYIESIAKKLETLLKYKIEITDSDSKLSEQYKKYVDKKTEIQGEYNNIISTCKSLKNELDTKNAELNLKTDDSVIEFEKMIQDFENKIDTNKLKVAELKNKETHYNKALDIFGDDGIRKTITNRVLQPMNLFIDENMIALDMPFRCILDDNFDALITDTFGMEIDSSTLSTGETKKINICIMMSYIMLIRLRKSINLLFLDEVFSSVDVDSIQLILQMLKIFTKKYNVNIFLVHHSQLESNMFDRHIEVYKNIFSNITEV